MDSKTHILTQYLNGELSVEEMTLIEEKILNFPEWKEEFILLQQIFTVADNFEYPESKKTESAWAEFSEKLTSEIVPIKVITPEHRFNWLKYAAIIALIFVASVGIYNLFFDKQIEWSSNDSRIIKELPDGSWVILEPKSTVEFNSKNFKQNRKVWVSGNVYFTVRKDRLNPFMVSFVQGQIKVEGTRFRFKQNEISAIVSLFSGSLSVFSRDNEMTLKPGQTVLVNQGHFTNLIQDNYDPYPEIFSLNFKDAALADIVKGLENRFDVSIRFPEKLKEQQYTVQAEGLILDDVLKVLAELTGTVVQKYPDYFELKF